MISDFSKFTAESIADHFDQIKLSKSNYQKINGRWYSFQTYFVDDEVDIDLISEVKEIIDGRSGYVISFTWRNPVDWPIPVWVGRFIFEDEDYLLEAEEVGSIEDFRSDILDHQESLRLKHQDQRFSCGYFIRGNERKSLEEEVNHLCKDLQSDSNLISIPYLGVKTNSVSEEIILEEVTMDVKTRYFVNEHGTIYELIE